MKRKFLPRISFFNSVLVVGLIAIPTALLSPLFLQYKGSRKTPCIGRLKQIGSATQIYCDANNDRLPQTDWVDALSPLIKNPKTFSCYVLEQQGGQYGFAMRYELIGLQLSKLNPNAILCFETDALGRNVVANFAAASKTRHGKHTLIVRVDGSAKHVSENSIDSLTEQDQIYAAVLTYLTSQSKWADYWGDDISRRYLMVDSKDPSRALLEHFGNNVPEFQLGSGCDDTHKGVFEKGAKKPALLYRIDTIKRVAPNSVSMHFFLKSVGWGGAMATVSVERIGGMWAVTAESERMKA